VFLSVKFSENIACKKNAIWCRFAKKLLVFHRGADDARSAPDAEVSLSDVCVLRFAHLRYAEGVRGPPVRPRAARLEHAFGVVLRVPRPAHLSLRSAPQARGGVSFGAEVSICQRVYAVIHYYAFVVIRRKRYFIQGFCINFMTTTPDNIHFFILFSSIE